MTHQQLRDLLRDRVADETMPDLSGQAWAAGARARRRRRAGVIAGAAAGVLAVAAITATVGDPRAPGPSSTPPVSSEPDATYEGTPIWWSPDQVEERSLPFVSSPLPEVIDLAGAAPGEDLGVAVAAFGIGDEVRLVAQSGAQASLDISSLDDVANENGYRVSPVTEWMLSPAGTRLVFPQDGSVVLYELGTGTWSGFDVPGTLTTYVTWRDDRTLTFPKILGNLGAAYDLQGNRLSGGQNESNTFNFPGFRTGTAQIYGPAREFRSPPEEGGPEDYFLSTAQSWGMGVPLPVREGYASDPEFLNAKVIVGLERLDWASLAFTNDVGDGTDTRWKQCCPVAGWLDTDTVVYESRQSQPLLVAWTVGTNQFRLVSRIEGGYDVASFASLHE